MLVGISVGTTKTSGWVEETNKKKETQIVQRVQKITGA